MTQELVLGGLLTGLIGLVWVMTVAVWEGKRASGQAREPERSGDSDEIQHRDSALHHQTFAA